MDLKDVLKIKPPYPYCSRKSRSFSGNILVWKKDDPTWRLYDLGGKEIVREEKKEAKPREDTTKQGSPSVETPRIGESQPFVRVVHDFRERLKCTSYYNQESEIPISG